MMNYIDLAMGSLAKTNLHLMSEYRLGLKVPLNPSRKIWKDPTF